MYVVGVLQHGNFLDIFCYFSFILVIARCRLKNLIFFFICTLSYFVQGACVRHKMVAVKWFQIKNEIIWNHWSQNLVRNFCSQEFVVKYWFRCENVVWWFCCQKLLSSIFNDEMRCVVSKPKFVQVRVCVCIFFCLLVTLSAAQTCSNVILSSTFLAQDFDVMWIEFSLWPIGCCAESDGFIFIWHFSNFGLVFMSWVYVDLVAANSLFWK